MKRSAFLILLLIIVLGTTTGFIISKIRNPMSVKVHAKDLPEYKLIIVKPSDPEFDALAATYLKDIPTEEIEAIKPISVFIKNIGDKTVVAHTIIWEGTDANGKKQTFRKNYANSEFFTEGDNYPQALAGANFDETIMPGEAHLVSLKPLKHDGPHGGGGGIQQDSDASQQSQNEPDKDNEQGVRKLGSQMLTKFIDITVSIDGVFFSDGAFVGPDTFGFFDRMKAQVDAKRDLARLIAEDFKQKKSEAEIFEAIETRARAEVKNLANQVTVADYYNYFSKFFAALILQQKRVYGGDKAIDIALRLHDRPQPNLHKL